MISHLAPVPRALLALAGVATLTAPGAAVSTVPAQTRAPELRVTATRGDVTPGRALVLVSGYVDGDEAAREVKIEGSVGRKRARICVARVTRRGSFEAECRVDQLLGGRPGLVRIDAELEKGPDSAAARASTSVGIPRPLPSTIVVGLGMPGMTLGTPRSKVVAAFGRPSWFAGPGGANVSFRGGRLDNILLHGSRPRTPAGIGVGSSINAARRAYPAARCATGPSSPTSRICFLSVTADGKRAEMYFRTGNGPRIEEISFHRPGAYAGVSPVAPTG